MLLVLLLVSSVGFGPCFGDRIQACYGKTLSQPILYTPPFYTGPVYFTPNDGGSAKIVIENGKSKDPRYSLSDNLMNIQDLTERDNGHFSIGFGGFYFSKLFELKILDCADEINRDYGHAYRYFSSKRFDVLEYTRINDRSAPKILWNRTGHDLDENSRVSVSSHFVNFRYLTQEDSGFYNFRDGNNIVVDRLRLTVKEVTKTKHATEGDDLVLEYTQTIKPWIVTFIPERQSHSVTTIRDGIVTQDDWFNGRIHVVGEGIEISPLERKDSGSFHFQDAKGNLALVVEVEVEKSETSGNVIYWVIGGLLSSLTFICCCRSCCCGKSSKKDKTAEEAAEPPDVYYHGENEPADPGLPAPPSSSTLSYRPVVSYFPEGSTAAPLDPPPYHSLNPHVNPAQPQVAPPDGLGSVPDAPVVPNTLSSDTEPRFELKGATFPSAPPLSSLSTSSDVYTSDKLNFL